MCIRDRVFDLIPVKKEIKAEVSGLYIVGVKGIRGNLDAPVKKKKGFFARFKKSAEEAQDVYKRQVYRQASGLSGGEQCTCYLLYAGTAGWTVSGRSEENGGTWL